MHRHLRSRTGRPRARWSLRALLALVLLAVAVVPTAIGPVPVSA